MIKSQMQKAHIPPNYVPHTKAALAPTSAQLLPVIGNSKATFFPASVFLWAK